MTERTLNERELNRALLARQLLLERSDMPIPRAIERLGGLQTQYAPAGYIGLWSRLADLGRDDLTRLLERRRVVHATLMRATIHMVSARDYRLFSEGVRQTRRAWWLSASRRTADVGKVEAAADRVRSFLADGPRTRAEILRTLDIDSALFGGAGMWVDLVRVPPSGTWERPRADLYALASEWLGPSPKDATPERGMEHLARRYLGAFGPASRADVANWAGVTATAMAPALERIRIRRFRDERGKELVDLPGAPLPDPDTPAPVRFLPVWDATLLVHARRTQILAELHRPRVFDTKTPHSVNTFLVDGQVAGTWHQHGKRVVTEPFGKLPRDTRRELEQEAERLEGFMA
jgi:hypothetical protein